LAAGIQPGIAITTGAVNCDRDTTPARGNRMKLTKTFIVMSLGATLFAACTRDDDNDRNNRIDAQQIEQDYGVPGAFAQTIDTADGPLKGTLVPITLANGNAGHLFIPQKVNNDADAVYVQDEQGLHPVRLSKQVRREDMERTPAVVEARAEPAPAKKKRSWEREALIIGGSAGAGTAIGALAGGKKGAGVGAAAGGVGGLIYDLATRDKK
jgi:hypothetical protein